MKKFFFRILFIFICLSLAILLKSDYVVTSYNTSTNSQFCNIISFEKNNLDFVLPDDNEHNIVAQNNVKTEISNTTSKKHNFGISFGKGNFCRDIFKCQIVCNKITFYKPKTKYLSQNLENIIYTRAP